MATDALPVTPEVSASNPEAPGGTATLKMAAREVLPPSARRGNDGKMGRV